MSNSAKVLSGLALASLAAGAVAAAPASADPAPIPTATKPASYRTYVAVGSDTIQDVWNGLSNGYKGTRATAPLVASYNAFPLNSTIQTRAKGPRFTRPSGSGAGVKALTASVKGTAFNKVVIKGQVDFARSSSGPVAGTGLTYMPFARDAVSVVLKTSAKGTVNFTTKQLVDIYTCKLAVVTTSTGAKVKVVPTLPQADSGTRKFFLKALGDPALGKCVVQTTAPENNGAALKTNGALIPFSAAQWIAQKNLIAPNTITADERIASINGAAPVAGVKAPFSAGRLFGSGASAPKSGTGVFARDTYNVIPTAKVGTPLEKYLVAASKQAVVIRAYGFLPLNYVGNKAFYKAGAFQS